MRPIDSFQPKFVRKGGFLASFFPANRIFGIAICTSALLNMTVPGAMSLDNITVLLLIRVLQGLVEGVVYPACHGKKNFDIFVDVSKKENDTIFGKKLANDRFDIPLLRIFN